MPQRNTVEVVAVYTPSDPAKKTASTQAKVTSSARSSPKRPAVCSSKAPSLTVQRTVQGGA